MRMLADNIGAFTDALGVENAPIVLWLSTVPWDGPEDRDAFIATLTGR